MIGPNDLKNLSHLITKETEHEVTEPVDYIVEQLDYSYIQTSTNVRELGQLLSVLRSGKEGYYPELEKAIEKRIQTLDTSITLNDSTNANDIKNATLDQLNNWTKELKLKEETILHATDLAAKKEMATPELDIFVSNSKASKLSSIPSIRSSISMTIEKPKTSNALELEHLADMEKIKGNDCFKAGEYEDAVAYYTRSLCIMERAHVYTNRAAALLKLKYFERAENDSSAALQLNDAEFMFKAYMRRAEARRKRGKLMDAIKDVDAALAINATSKLAIQLRKQMEKEFRDREGDAAEQVLSQQTIRDEPLPRIVELPDDYEEPCVNAKQVNAKEGNSKQVNASASKELHASTASKTRMKIVDVDEVKKPQAVKMKIIDVEQDSDDD